MAEAAVTRFGADCVERLNRDPGTLDGPLEGRAAILSLLAARALYRNDLESAKRHAEAARALGALGATRQAVDVLRVLALRQGDGSRAEALEREKSKLPWNDYAFAHRGEPDSKALDQELSEAQAKNKPDKPDKPDEPDKPDKPEPPAARNVHSALRACIEPVRERLPKATGTGAEKRIATITLHAKVFEDGHAELEVGADREDEGMAQVLECLKSDGPRMLARAPSSVSAKIVLDESVRRAQAETWGLFGTLGDSFGVEGLGGLSGADIGEAYGVGGLGLVGTGRGGGGTGEGIGLGSVGVIGHGSGTGSGYGRGSGRLGGRKTKQKPPPKAKPAPKK